MSKIVSMSSGAIDPIAVTKRVFWRPSTTGTALKVGDPVCYKQDAVDHKERTVDPTHLGLTIDTYGQGEQEFTGRLFSVEEPDITNIDLFAGIVKSLGPQAGADGDFIEIFKANSGAVVPCNIQAVAAGTVVGRTLLAIKVGTRTLGVPTSNIPNFGITAGNSDSKVVGIAMEIRTTAGVCWVKLDENQFMHQGGQIGYEFDIPAGSGNVTVNQANLSFANTGGNCTALHMRTILSGTGGYADRGVYRFETFLSGTASGTVHGLMSHLEFLTTESGGAYAPLKLSIRSRVVDANLSGMQNLAAINIDFILAAASGNPLTNPPAYSSIIYVNTESGATQPDYFLTSELLEGVGGAAQLADTSTQTWGTDDITIPIRLGGITYYIYASVAAQAA
ncbi:hypothetical protein KAR91_78805 [Candidatus Pacearchaeota archaeon]|nr:hypothetical protein [Candidatus Pacearchaeota archaeon]